MLTIRLFEHEVKQLYRAGEISGAIHLYIGQEAVAVGVCSALQDTDYVTSTHRGHGHLIAKGGDLKTMMAELMGKVTGCSGGYGGSMHMFDFAKGFLGGNGIVGGGIPLGIGAAFSAKYRKTDSVAISFFGEGASNQGTFHESLNLAALWKLPYIAVCENNQYAATTPVGKSTSVIDIASRAAGYDIPGVVVDGNDCSKIYQAASKAISRARKNNGPTLIECKTYRVEPHCGIIADQRPEGERETWVKEQDPLEIIKSQIPGFTHTVETKLQREVETEIFEAVEFARNSPEPKPEDLLEEYIEE